MSMDSRLRGDDEGLLEVFTFPTSARGMAGDLAHTKARRHEVSFGYACLQPKFAPSRIMIRSNSSAPSTSRHLC
jgi:hypothetical protein